MLFSLSFSYDATIDVVKKIESLPTIAVEDASREYDSGFKLKFFKMLIADLNVISIFNVENNYKQNDMEASNVLVENKDMNYVLRYELDIGDSYSFEVNIKLLQNVHDLII